jgi:hypothetical protein
MSCDYGVWFPSKRLTDKEAGELYVRLCDGDKSGVVPHPAVDAFYAELTAIHPEIDNIPKDRVGDHDYCPWSCAMDYSPGHVIVSCTWPKATYVDKLVEGLARKHGLALYDPQSDEVTYPDGATGETTGKTGMSASARWVLGLFALLFAVIFVYSERTAPSNAPYLMYLFAAFCVFLAVACFSRNWRVPAARVIGFMILLGVTIFIVEELFQDFQNHFENGIPWHWFGLIILFLIYGLPGAYVAVRGKYPKWAIGAEAFNGKSRRSSDEESDTDEDANTP